MTTDKSIEPHQWTHGGTHVLIVKCVNKDGTSYNGFQWPLTVGAEVSAPDWNDRAECGGGLHGWPWGLHIGDGKEPDWSGAWLVFSAKPENVVTLGGKCKASHGTIVFVGDWQAATNHVLAGQMALTFARTKLVAAQKATGDRSSAAATGYQSSAAATGYQSSAAATGDQSSAAATGDQSSAAATGDWSSAAATGDQSSAAATGYQSSAAATGDQSSAAATGDQSSAAATGYQSSAAATGDQSSAAATGYQSSAAATGYQSSAAATGDQSSAAATGDQSSAAATGYQSSAAATGDQSSAAATGYQSSAAAIGTASVSAVTGADGTASGGTFSAIVLSWWNAAFKRYEMRAAEIGVGDGSDGKLKAGVMYRLNETGAFVEARS